MARVVKGKELINTRLAANYGGWIYCDGCQKNIGYLCYSTYDSIKIRYKCNCGSSGFISLDFADGKIGHKCANELITIKNRLCCPSDNEPLITLLNKKLKSYELEITCKFCGGKYKKRTVTS